MTNMRVKWAFLVIVLLTFGYYLLPTLRYYNIPPEERSDPKYSDIQGNSMRLGLDLQGGSYLVYEVDLENLDENQDKDDVVPRAIEIIRNRVDQFGVTEPVIQRQGENRIVVQLPGLQDPARAKELVGKTAQLEFTLVKTRQEMFQALSRVDQAVARSTMLGDLDLSAPDTTAADTSAAGDSLLAADTTAAAADTALTASNGAPFSSLLQQVGEDVGMAFCPEANLGQAERMLNAVAGNPADGKPATLAGGTVLLWGEQEFSAGNPGRFLYAVSANAPLTGDNVADAQVAFGLEPARPNAAGVSLTLDKRGATIFTKLTGDNVGRQLAIVLDNKVKSAPFIRDKIRGGRASITGLAGDDEARDLGIVLRAGALPTDLIPQEERTVGPSLGHDSIQQGIRAAFVGLGLVIVLMGIYYRASGLLAVVALLLNLFFLFSALGMLRGTLTLPGIAGIVLTIGMAVDANVLVLERIREEIRAGKTVRGAIDAGYARALVTILDSNITTLISSIVLFQFGTGPIKGFATTLMIGIIANIFTAVFVTRLIYDSIVTGRSVKKLSI